jgi:hypothetical protein
MSAGRPHKCPYCGGTDTASKGARKTKTMGLRKIRRCKGCGRKFTPKSQKLTPTEALGPIQPGSPESVEAEVGASVEPCALGSTDSELPTTINPAKPTDEHPRYGL